MKLYEVRTWDENGHTASLEIHFVSSQQDIPKLIRKKSKYRVSEVILKDRMTKQDLIHLLEGDSPGQQEQIMTPVDLIIQRRILKEKL